YLVGNSGSERRAGRLLLAVRPFQVNPPTQFLNGAGGVARIESLRWDGSAVVVDGTRRVIPRVSPAGFGAVPFDSGSVPRFLAPGALPAGKERARPLGLGVGTPRVRSRAAPRGVRRSDHRPAVPSGGADAGRRNRIDRSGLARKARPRRPSGPPRRGA